MISVKKVLEEKEIKVSAPCRIDAGGTWDIKAMALPFEDILPTTVNIALDLRTYVHILPFDEGYIKISSKGFEEKIISLSSISFEPPYGLFIAAVRFFGFHGLEIKITSSAPVQSGLGGSSTALVAVIKALSEIKAILEGKSMDLDHILFLSYHIEDAISGGGCGAQDQGAGIFGGVNKWIWKYSKPYICERIPLLDKEAQNKLSEHILVLYTGEKHTSSAINQGWIREFLSGKTQKGWIEANQIVHEFSDALQKLDIRKAIECLNREMEIREKITPDAFTPLIKKLIRQAQQIGAGARFAGAGAGGSVWALAEKEDIKKLSHLWQESISDIKDAKILSCKPDPKGLIMHS